MKAGHDKKEREEIDTLKNQVIELLICKVLNIVSSYFSC